MAVESDTTKTEHEKHDHPPLVTIESYDVKETENWQREVTVTLAESDWTEARKQALSKVRKSVKIDGYREGKVPKEVVTAQYGPEIEREALEYLLPRAWHQLLHEVDLQAVADPEFTDVDFGDGKPVTLKAVVEVRPEVKIKGYKGIKVTWYKEPVPEGAVEQTLEQIRESRAEYTEVDRPAAEGDRCTVDFRQVDPTGVPIIGTEVKDHPVEIGSPMVLPAFSEGLLGLAVSGERRIPVSYPDDYQEKDLAGQTREFLATVTKVEEKHLPELNDEFAASVGDFENIGALNEQIAENIRQDIEGRNRERLETALVSSLLAINEFGVPPRMVTHFAEQMIKSEEERRGVPIPDDEKEKAREGLRPGAELAIKRWFLLDSVAEQEKLHCTDDDLEKHLEMIAAAEGIEIEKVRETVDRQKAEGRMREDLQQKKVFEFLQSQAKVKEEEIKEPAPTA